MRSSRGRMEITILGSTLSRIIKYKVQGNGWGCLKTLHLYLCFGRGGQITHRNFIIDNCACHMKWLSIYPFSLSLSLYIYIYLHHSVEGWKILCTNMLEKEVASHSSILAWRIPVDRGAWQAAVYERMKCYFSLKGWQTNYDYSDLEIWPAFSQKWTAVSLTHPGKQLTDFIANTFYKKKKKKLNFGKLVSCWNDWMFSILYDEMCQYLEDLQTWWTNIFQVTGAQCYKTRHVSKKIHSNCKWD